jgi:hypothetical protein
MRVYLVCDGVTLSVLQFDPRTVSVGFVVDKVALEKPPLPTKNFGFSLSSPSNDFDSYFLNLPPTLYNFCN